MSDRNPKNFQHTIKAFVGKSEVFQGRGKVYANYIKESSQKNNR